MLNLLCTSDYGKIILVYTHQSGSLKQVINKKRWLPPPQSQYKLNSDAALKEHHQLCSMALRDHVGQITDGIAQNGSCSFPLAGENRAMTAADMLAKAIQYQSIIFKSNSEILVKAINATFHPCFKPQEISRSIKLLFQNRFTEFKFVHCLAKLAFAYCIPCN